jgi:hypothetical protein
LTRFAIVAACCESPRPVIQKIAYPSAFAWLTRSTIPGVAGKMFPVNVVPVRPTKLAFVAGLKSQLLYSS